jgi:hypothetical protein
MRVPTESYLEVNYALRPSKEVERRMIIDGLHILSCAGLPIRDYQYTGFGSFYYVDFILFHKLLGIEDMLNVEYSQNIKKRIKFNKPFKFIKIEMLPICDVIPNLSKDLRHILWLDYDNVIGEETLRDILLAVSQLSLGSILLITIDVEPPVKESNDPKDWQTYYESETKQYLGLQRLDDFTKSRLPITNARILHRVIKTGLGGRDIKFFPIFFFKYSDGHEMITIGGILGSNREHRLIGSSGLKETSYYRSGYDDPYQIIVPRITRKERLHLDSAMPCCEGWKPKEFEFTEKNVAAYREIYRFFPDYAELLF